MLKEILFPFVIYHYIHYEWMFSCDLIISYIVILHVSIAGILSLGGSPARNEWLMEH